MQIISYTCRSVNLLAACRGVQSAPELCAALLMFQGGKLSAGAPCKLAGVDRFTFLVECHHRDVAVIDYPAEALHAETESLREQRPA